MVNQTDNTVSILLGNGDGTFTDTSTVIVGNGPTAITTGNFDTSSTTSNFLGLAVTNGSDGTVSILLGNGNGSFNVPAAPAPSPPNPDPAAILPADFNNDGLPDLVVANEGSDTVSVYLGLGDGTFLPPLSVATGNTPVALAAGDVNNDGFSDVAVSNESSDTASVILNTNVLLSSLLGTNAASTPYPGSEYVDLGLKVQATSRMHPNGEATLALDMDIISLSGQNVNGIPILSNRTITQSVRLQENQTSVLSGIMESSDLRSLSGLPWLANAGGLGYLAGTHGTQQADTELLIAITPREMRLPARIDQTIYAGRGAGSERATSPHARAPKLSRRAPSPARKIPPRRSQDCSRQRPASQPPRQ